MIFKSLAAILIVLCLTTTTIYGGINPVLNYQGYLADSSGAPYPDGNSTFTFTIYDDSLVGTPLWTEAQILTLEDGYVNAYLGEIVTFSNLLFENYPLYLGISYGGEPEFSPRILLASSAYSFMAGNSEKLAGFEVSHFIDSTNLEEAVEEHRLNQSAHHTKTTDAGELISGTLDLDRLPLLEISGDNIVDGSLTSVDLSDSTIDGQRIKSGSIEAAHLASSSVGSDKIIDNSLTGTDLADSTISGDKIASGTISQEHLASLSIDSNDVVDNSLTGTDLADSTISGDKIASGTIGPEHLTSLSIDSDDVVDNSLTGADLADSTISGDKIAPGTIDAEHLSSSFITGENITDNSITSIDILDGTIGGQDIGSNAIVSSHILSGSITGNQIADGAISGNDISYNAISTQHVANGSLSIYDLGDEPGLDYAESNQLFSVGSTVTNWMSVTISAPTDGYIIAFFNCTSQLAKDEVAQAGISTDASTIGTYGQSRITSSATGTGADIPISISHIIPVLAGGDITIYANCRATPSSAGVVDFLEGRLQAIFIRTKY